MLRFCKDWNFFFFLRHDVTLWVTIDSKKIHNFLNFYSKFFQILKFHLWLCRQNCSQLVDNFSQKYFFVPYMFTKNIFCKIRRYYVILKFKTPYPSKKNDHFWICVTNSSNHLPFLLTSLPPSNSFQIFQTGASGLSSSGCFLRAELQIQF
jgi:hypothetical protein